MKNKTRYFICFAVFLSLCITTALASTMDNFANLYITQKYGEFFPDFGSPYTIEESEAYVNSATGEFRVNTEDYHIYGKNGFDVSIVRSYNTSSTESDIETVYYNDNVNSTSYFSRNYICSEDNCTVSIHFQNETELLEADISFEGYFYQSTDTYDYSKLACQGTGIFYTATDSTEEAEVVDTSVNYKLLSIHIDGYRSFVETPSGMRISKPSLENYDLRGPNDFQENYLMFQDLNGESHALSIIYDTEKNPDVFLESSVPPGISYSKYKAFPVNKDNVMECTVHPKGFRYNMTLKSDDGDVYYVYFDTYTTNKVLYAEDRYGNSYAIDSDRDNNYWSVTTEDDTVYSISQNGIIKTESDGTETTLVSYSNQTVNSADDPYDKYDIDDEYIFTVTKNSGTQQDIQSNEENETRYYVKRAIKYDKIIQNGELNAYKLPYKVELPSGMTKMFEYAPFEWAVNSMYSEDGIYGYNYLVSEYYEFGSDNTTPVNRETYTYTPYTDTSIYNRHMPETYITNIEKSNWSANSVYKTTYTVLDKNRRIINREVEKEYSVEDLYIYTYQNTNPDSAIITEERVYGLPFNIGPSFTQSYKYLDNDHLSSENIGDYTANYTYHTSDNYIPRTMTYNMDSDTTIKTENILTEDKKSIATTNVYENDTLIKSISYTYDAYGNIATEKVTEDEDSFYITNYTHTYGSDGSYTVTASKGNMQTVSVYDCNRNLISYTDGNGNVTTMTYDNANRLLAKFHPDGTTESYTYDISNGITTYTAPNGTVYKSYYNEWENPIRTTVILDGEEITLEQYQYDDRCNISSYKRYHSSTEYTEARYIYDIFDRPTEEKIYDNGTFLVKTTAYTYTTSYGLKNTPNTTVTMSVTGDDGTYAQASQTVNFRGFVIQDKVFTDNDSRITTYTHDYVGNVVTTTDALGNVTLAEYNGLNNPVKVTSPDGSTVITGYNMAGLVSSVTDARGNTSHNYYDNTGRLIKTTSPIDEQTTSETTITYDANGNAISQNSLSSIAGEYEEYIRTDTEYDSMNRPVTVTTYPAEDTESVTKYSYDSMGNITSITTGLANKYAPLSSGRTTAYDYDALGRMTKETTPEGKVQTYAYDLTGRLLTSTDKKNVQTQYTYDVLDNLLRLVKDGQSVSYTYDLNGNRTSMTDSTGTTSYTYSPYGELTSEQKDDILKSYAYDALGRRLSMSISDGEESLTNQTYTYDNMNRLISTQNGTDTAEYTYDANSNLLTEKVNGNLLKITTYNAGNLPEIITTYLPDTTETSHRTYSANGNLRIEIRNDRDIFYYYDGANRLIAESYLGDNIFYEDHYTYDLYGNRTEKSHTELITGTNTDTVYTYNSLNQLTMQSDGTNTLTYNYDTNGNMLSIFQNGTPIKTYTYDVFNRLATTNVNGNTASYTYNGDNLRQTKTVNSVTTEHIYDGQNIVADVSHNTNVYVYGADILGMRTNGGNLQTYITTPRGDISKLISPNGTYDEYEYDAYGNPIVGNDHSVNPFGYTGEYQDLCSGLIYLRNRYYDPSIGRFISEDTHWNPNNMIYGDNQKAVKYAIINDQKIYFDQDGKVIKKEVHNQDMSLPSNVSGNDYVQENIQFYNIQRIPDNNSIMQSINLYAYCMNNPINYQDKTGESATATVIITAPKWVPWVIAGATAVVTAITGYYASNNQKGLEKGMSKNQKEKFQREIEDFKRGMGRGPGDHLPWEILVEIAEEIRKNYK